MTRVRPKNRCKDPLKMITCFTTKAVAIDCLIESQTQDFRALFAKQASISVTPKWKTGGWFWYIPNRTMFFMLSASVYTRKHLYSAKFNCVHYFDRANVLQWWERRSHVIYFVVYMMICYVQNENDWDSQCVCECAERLKRQSQHTIIIPFLNTTYIYTRCALVSTENAKSSCVKKQKFSFINV